MANDTQNTVVEIEVGDELHAWETWEFPPYERSRSWYLIATALSLAFILYAIWIQSYLFAIIVLLMGVMMLVNNLRKPERIMVYVTTLGIVVGNEFYSYRDMKNFSVVFNPPLVKNLYLRFNSILQPMLVIPLESQNPVELRETLLLYAMEDLEREEEDLTDVLRRVYKL